MASSSGPLIASAGALVTRALALQRLGQSRSVTLLPVSRNFSSKSDDGSSEDGKQPGLMRTIFGSVGKAFHVAHTVS